MTRLTQVNDEGNHRVLFEVTVGRRTDGLVAKQQEALVQWKDRVCRADAQQTAGELVSRGGYCVTEKIHSKYWVRTHEFGVKISGEENGNTLWPSLKGNQKVSLGGRSR